MQQVIKGQRIRASSQPLFEEEQAVLLPHPSSSFSLNVDSFMSHQPNQNGVMTVDKRQEQSMDNCVKHAGVPLEDHNELFLEEKRRKTTMDMCEADFFITSTAVV